MSMVSDEIARKPHRKLRRMLAASDIDEECLARKLLRGRKYISTRMMGHMPWTLDECYQILDLLRLPHSELPNYFPRGGVSA